MSESFAILLCLIKSLNLNSYIVAITVLYEFKNWFKKDERAIDREICQNTLPQRVWMENKVFLESRNKHTTRWAARIP